MKDSDLRNSSAFQRNRTKADEEGVSGGVCTFDNEDSICKASSTRNWAAISMFSSFAYHFGRRENHRRGGSQDCLLTDEVQAGFGKIVREIRLGLEARPEGFVFLQHPQPRPVASPDVRSERGPRLIHL
jgi:hypothetical protein